MNHFERVDGALHCEQVALSLIAEKVGTPAYVYSRATLERHYRVFDEAWASVDHLVCFAVKACSNIAILRLLANLGAGFDIVSGGELHRVLRAGGDAKKIVYSGVGKTKAEMAQALEAGIMCFNVESLEELEQLSEVACAMGVVAPVSLRINPEVDAKTHPYIATGLRETKFGIPYDKARDAYLQARSLPGLNVTGLDCHIGSQISDTGPLIEATRRLLELIDTLKIDGFHLEHLDLGGGLGITYSDETPPTPDDYAQTLLAELGERSLRIILEPGRVIAGNAAVLLTRILLTKDNANKRFIVVDAAMNDAIRPALYGAWHGIEPVEAPRQGQQQVDVVGPICESGDFFAKERDLPPLQSDDLIVLQSAGAYGFTMASNYNSRPRVAEVLVDGDRFAIIRRRETLEELCRGESLLEDAKWSRAEL